MLGLMSISHGRLKMVGLFLFKNNYTFCDGRKNIHMIPLLFHIPLKGNFIELFLVIALTAFCSSIFVTWCALASKQIMTIVKVLRFCRPLFLLMFFILSLQSTLTYQYLIQGLLLMPLIALFWLKPMKILPECWFSETRELGADWWGRCRYFWWPLLKTACINAIFCDLFFSLLL